MTKEQLQEIQQRYFPVPGGELISTEIILSLSGVEEKALELATAWIRQAKQDIKLLLLEAGIDVDN